MPPIPKALEKFIPKAREELEKGVVGEIIFSRGTYEVEVKEKKATFWPFLQIDDQGKLLDSFCSCKSQEKSCIHIAIAYVFITDTKPLHTRFEKSFWNVLFQIAAKRHGFSPSHFFKDAQKQGKRS